LTLVPPEVCVVSPERAVTVAAESPKTCGLGVTLEPPAPIE
jgi:hypothetical protein